MGDVIRLLPDSVANQIAAGEVIQRPASVVKELVENALDANAGNIKVVIVDAGKTSIQVIDDGKGMSETDARLAFERHATSKISSAADLFALQTMGFRGEALASIAAVAQVELRTRTNDCELGVSLRLSGSKIETQEPIACPVGANFAVRNLFFNVPVRRKFLKSNQTELSNILMEFERIALAHEDIRFTLIHNDVTVMSLAQASTRQRIIDVFGKKLNQQLLSVKVDTTLVRVFGYVGTPDSSRKKGAHQYFFVNGRFMRHPYFQRAVMSAYERLIPNGEQVSYFIYLEVDPARIDVNIHPTKTEIKFEDEQAIWQILQAATKEALGKFNATPSIDFDAEERPQIPAFSMNDPLVSPPIPEYNPKYTPFEETSRQEIRNHSAKKDWEALFDVVHSNEGFSQQNVSVDSFENLSSERFSSLYDNCVDKERKTWEDVSTICLSYKGTYILSPMKDGLMIIDQRRAHIRVLYDKYMEQLQKGTGTSQGVLFPEIVEFSPSQAVVLNELLDELTAVGFDLSNLGGGSFSINGIPAGTDHINPVILLRDILDQSCEQKKQVKEEINHVLAMTLSQKAAISYGEGMSQEQMAHLIHTLFACKMPTYTPDGKLIYSIFEDERLEKIFI